MELTDLRKKIDEIDDEIVSLYLKRMGIVAEIAQAKKETNAPVCNSERESEILSRLTKNVPDEYKIYLKEIYSAIFKTSKAYQLSVKDLTNKAR